MAFSTSTIAFCTFLSSRDGIEIGLCFPFSFGILRDIDSAERLGLVRSILEPPNIYRVFVTDRKEAIDLLVWFYNQRAGAENLIEKPTTTRDWPGTLPSVGGQLRAFPVGDAGLQPELLAAAVQPGRKGASR